MIKELINKITEKDEKYQKKINVRFPDKTGDSQVCMTIQELKDEHSNCLIIDPTISEQVSFEDLVNLNIPEVIALSAIQGG
jgi:hypothetical protein